LNEKKLEKRRNKKKGEKSLIWQKHLISKIEYETREAVRIVIQGVF
jgi:hypothetical protein